MEKGKQFRTFIEALHEGNVLCVYLNECDPEVEVHTDIPKVGKLVVWTANCSGGLLWTLDVCKGVIEELIDGALQLRGLTLSGPIIVDEEGSPLPLLTSGEDDSSINEYDEHSDPRAPRDDSEAIERAKSEGLNDAQLQLLMEVRRLAKGGKMEYRVIKLEEGE